jgi:putative ABC transport system permease protein
VRDVVRVFFSRLLRRERFEGELSEELRFHVEARAEDLERTGLSPEEARRRARVELGGVEQCKESLRAERPGAVLDEIAQDVRLSLRRLRREPQFALAVAVTLSLGIGAATAVFGMVSTTLLSRIPYAEPDRLVVGRTTWPDANDGFVSGLDYFDYRESSRSFDDLAGFYAFPMSQTVTGGGDPWAAQSGYVTWNLFRTLRVNPVLGRHFLPEEEALADARVAIISFGLWQRRFGGAPAAVGRTLVLDGVPHTVVGVLPRGFRFVWDAEVWRVAARPGETRDRHNFHLVGRLRPGVSIAQARRDVDAVSRTLQQAYPASNKDKGLGLISLQEYVGGDVRAGLLLPAAATACLLLIACANVAGLLLARGRRRTAEIAMRSALGASRWRLIRQLLTESVVLTLPAGVLGIGVSYALQGLLLHLLPVATLGVTRPVVDGRVLLFAFAASVATGLVVGVVPSVRGTAVSLSPQLGTGRNLGERARGSRLRGGLVVLQIAITVVLLVGSGLLARSLLRLTGVDLGFSTERVLTARVEIQAPAYPERARRQAFFSSVLQDVRALPGVRSAAAVARLPIKDPGNIWRTRASDRPLGPGENGERTLVRRVSAGYFATMSMPLARGRDFSETDRDGAPAVAVLSQSLARRLYPDLDPLGRSLVMIDNISGTEVPYEVVGVVQDARLSDPRTDGDPAMYLSSLQGGATALTVVIRTAGDPLASAAPVREIVRRLDRNALVTDVLTMNAVVDQAYAGFRRVVRYLGLFALIALLLAAVGLYGALAYHVGQQEHEIGVRLAIGATRADILGMVLRRGARLVLIGLFLGAAVAYPGTRLVQSLLFETAPLDWATYLGAALLLGLVAAAACLLPALRAVRVEPLVVLRSE